jgi:hypothetical protein
MVHGMATVLKFLFVICTPTSSHTLYYVHLNLELYCTTALLWNNDSVMVSAWQQYFLLVISVYRLHTLTHNKQQSTAMLYSSSLYFFLTPFLFPCLTGTSRLKTLPLLLRSHHLYFVFRLLLANQFKPVGMTRSASSKAQTTIVMAAAAGRRTNGQA